ncbi:MAG TPA: PIN domain-containing protein [Cyclobacteriaceae bacterium]|nr:PIN domain-containing protein [Cyclobacteriaceae bacterium]
MIIVDTSVWIDFFRGSNQPLIDKLELLIENSEAAAISCVFGELLQGVKNEGEEKIILDFWNNLPKLDETNLFIDAGKSSAKHKLINKEVGLIDSYILAAVLKYNLSLWTFDKKLNEAFSSMLLS